MNMNLIGIVALCAGIILIYAGIKKKDPRDIIKEALTAKGSKGKSVAPSKAPGTVGQAAAGI